MKTMGPLKNIRAFIILILVVFLTGIAFQIYAGPQDTKQVQENTIKPVDNDTEEAATNNSADTTTKKKQIKEAISLKAGKVGKLLNIKLPDILEEKSRAKASATPGKKNPNWVLANGQTLPEGLVLLPNGDLIGKPTKKGKYKVEVKETNSGGTYEVSLDIAPFIQTESLRMITGYEISRASCTTGEEKGFIELYLSQPLPFALNKERGKLQLSPIRVWGNARLTSIPQQNTKNLGAVGPDYFTSLSDLKLNEMSQAAEFLLGIEYNIGSVQSPNGAYNYTLGLIASLGGSTPLVSENVQPVVYNIPSSTDQIGVLKERYPGINLEGKKYISFIPEDRDRFYRQCYLGLRWKKYSVDAGMSELPAMFDLTYGINDAVSGGNGRFFNRTVFRFDGFIPIKIFDTQIFLFGTVIVNANKGTVVMPLILGKPESDIPIDSNELLILPATPNNRDTFKIGIGIDLLKIFKEKQD